MFLVHIDNSYNTIFILLMSLKRAQLQLRKTWILHQDNDPNHHYRSWRQLWVLRHSISHFLDAWMSYLQLDVIVPHFQHIMTLLESYSTNQTSHSVMAGTLDLAKSHRDQYLKPILLRSFTSIQPVVQSVRELVDVGMALSLSLEQVFRGDVSFEVFEQEVDRLSKVGPSDACDKLTL